MRAAEAQGPAAALGTLVAVGDAAAQVAQEELGAGPETAELVTVLTRVTAGTARLVNDLIAEELERRIGPAPRSSPRKGDAMTAGAPPATPTPARSDRRTRTR